MKKSFLLLSLMALSPLSCRTPTLESQALAAEAEWGTHKELFTSLTKAEGNEKLNDALEMLKRTDYSLLANSGSDKKGTHSINVAECTESCRTFRSVFMRSGDMTSILLIIYHSESGSLYIDRVYVESVGVTHAS